MRACSISLWLALAAGAVAAKADDLRLAPQQMTAARKLYVAKCAKCHRFYEPLKYSGEEWRTWMEKMSRKSNLKADQASLLTRYLDAYRAGLLPGKPQAQ